ncbi:MAG: FG-GAP repeat domain-containing protein [Ramlibacter sp.]
MELMGLALGLLGIFLSIAIAIWQHSKAKSAEQHLASVLSSLPEVLLEGIGKAITSRAQTGGEKYVPDDSHRMFRARYADVDGDGEDELLVEMNTGAYASVLLVYGLRSWEFKKIGELYSTVTGGFEIADFDGDGRLEVRTDEIAHRPGLPYVAGLRDEVVYRLQDGTFVELSRKECFSEEEMRERQAGFASDT